jgi:hypothetical protein
MPPCLVPAITFRLVLHPAMLPGSFGSVELCSGVREGGLQDEGILFLHLL